MNKQWLLYHDQDKDRKLIKNIMSKNYFKDHIKKILDEHPNSNIVRCFGLLVEYINGKNYRQIAKENDISHKRVYRLIKRAYEELRFLKDNHYDRGK